MMQMKRLGDTIASTFNDAEHPIQISSVTASNFKRTQLSAKCVLDGMLMKNNNNNQTINSISVDVSTQNEQHNSIKSRLDADPLNVWGQV